MYRIDESKALGLLSIGAIVFRIAQQSRRHARPESKDYEGDQVADGHSSSSGFIQSRTSADVVSANTAGQDTALAGSGDIVEHYQEEDSSGDMNEGVETVDPVQDRRMREEPFLDGQLPEDMKAFLEVDEV